MCFVCREVALRPRQAAGGRADGECFARISVRTLLVKKWKITYFIFELPDLLLLYRSRDDHMYNPRGTMIKKRVEVKHNHTLTRLKRKVRFREVRGLVGEETQGDSERETERCCIVRVLNEEVYRPGRK